MTKYADELLQRYADEAERGYDPATLRPVYRPRRSTMVRLNPNQECCEHVSCGLFEHHTDRCIDRHGRWLVRRDGWADNTRSPWTVWRFNEALDAHGAWAVCRTQQEAFTVVKHLMRKYANEPPEQELEECTVA